jgi:hypothetical protein
MTSEKIKDVLQKLGYKLTDFGNHWRTNALYRGGKNLTALQIYKNSGVWVDYVNNSQHLPLKSLIEATLQTNDSAEVNKLLEGYDFDSISSQIEAPNIKPRIEMEKTYPDSILEKLLPHYKFYNDRGVGDHTLRFFKCGLATQGSMYQRFVFPIYNSLGQIHGFSGRDMLKNSSKKGRPKWKHTGKKSTWVYPYYLTDGAGNFPTQEEIKRKQEVILVESIGDLLRLHDRGFRNVLCVFGTSVSNSLACHLMALGLKRVVLSLNNDHDKEKNRGEIGSLKSYLKLLSFFDKDKLIVHPPTSSDFGEMQDEEFKTWNNQLKDFDVESGNKNNHKKILQLIDSKDIASSSYKKKYFS